MVAEITLLFADTCTVITFTVCSLLCPEMRNFMLIMHKKAFGSQALPICRDLLGKLIRPPSLIYVKELEGLEEERGEHKREGEGE